MISRSFVPLAAACLVAAVSCSSGESPSDVGRRREGPEASVSAAAAQARSPDDLLTLSEEAIRTTGIETARVERKPVRDEIRTTAVIQANEYGLAHVSPRIPGKAIAVEAVLGDTVKPGEVLAELDSLELGEKKSEYLKSRANLEVARRNYEREKRLFKRHVSSEKEYLEAKGEFERSEAAYRAAREALRLVGLSDEEIDRITWGGRDHPLSHFPLRAPLAGTVIERHATIGELIRPEDTPFTVADLRTVWVLVDVYEKDLARVTVGDPATVRVDAYPGEDFRGAVAYLSSVVDAATRTTKARIEVSNADRRLRPGMFATTTLTVSPPGAATALVVPENAIQKVHEKDVAFVAEKPGGYRMRDVRIGRKVGEGHEVLAGLAQGEQVVTKGGFYLKSLALREEIGGED